MLMRALVMLLIGTAGCFAQTLRVSKAFDQPAVGTEMMRFTKEGYTLIYHVEVAAILTEKDVASARVVEAKTGILEVKLTAGGAKKLKEATKGVAGGLRLGIFVDEELESAPLVMGELADTIRISGLEHLEEQELAELAKGLAQGK